MPNTLIAGCIYFAIVFSAAFAMGVLRGLVIAPALGEVMAVLIEVPIILAVSWWVCAWVLRHIAIPHASGRIAMGAIAFGLLMVAELLLSLLIGHLTAAQHFALFRTVPVLIGLIGQICFAAIPLLQDRAYSAL